MRFQSESQELAQILQTLRFRGYFCWRNNSGVFERNYTTKSGVKKKSFVRAGLTGSPDIIGVSPSGKFIGIEVKSSGACKKAGLTPQQKAFKNEVEKRNGQFIVVDRGFKSFLTELKDHELAS